MLPSASYIKADIVHIVSSHTQVHSKLYHDSILKTVTKWGPRQQRITSSFTSNLIKHPYHLKNMI